MAPADKIKVAYTYQFTRFVTWPKSLSAKNKAFTICVLGDEPIRNQLVPLNQRQVNNRWIKVRHLKSLPESKGCHLLYVAKTEQYRVKLIIDYLDNKPVLTVSSIPDFAKSGGMIDYVIRNKKVRLEINHAAARRAKLNISAKLLEISHKIFNGDVAVEGK